MQKTVVAILQDHQPGFHQVVSFHPESDRLLLMDFTENNGDISEELINDTHRFSDYINHKLRSANAKFGIGGYNEYRELYSRSQVFDSEAGEVTARLEKAWPNPAT